MGACLLIPIIAILALFILALIALIRCRPEDIPAIVKNLAPWWRK